MIRAVRAYVRPEEALFCLYGLALVVLWRVAGVAHFTETLHRPFIAVVTLVTFARPIRDRGARGGEPLQTLRHFLPFLATGLLCETLHDLAALLCPARVDEQLATIDRHL